MEVICSPALSMEETSITDCKEQWGLSALPVGEVHGGLQEELLVGSRKAEQRMRFRLLGTLNHFPQKNKQCVEREGVNHAVDNIISQGTAGAIT